MRVYALVEIGDDQAVDVFVRCEDAFAALDAAIEDEPDWRGILCDVMVGVIIIAMYLPMFKMLSLVK